MMRYFYYLTGWLACWLAAPTPARATSTPSVPVQESSLSSSAACSESEDTVITTRVPLRFPNSDPASLSQPASPSPARNDGSTPPRSFGIGAMSTKSATIHLIGQPAPSLAAQPVVPPAPSHPAIPAEAPSSKLTIASPSAIIAYKARVGPPLPQTPANPFAHKGVTLPYAENFAQQAADAARLAASARHELVGRLARLTAYWAGEGDYYTGKHLASTGIHLHGGVCAVDPSIIPYGSVVVIPGLGQFLAADTGSAVISRAAAREAGRTLAERSALVIDIFFEDSSEGQAFAAQQPKFVAISWWTPSSTSHAAQAARSVFADEDWNKIYNKQL